MNVLFHTTVRLLDNENWTANIRSNCHITIWIRIMTWTKNQITMEYSKIMKRCKMIINFEIILQSITNWYLYFVVCADHSILVFVMIVCNWKPNSFEPKQKSNHCRKICIRAQWSWKKFVSNYDSANSRLARIKKIKYQNVVSWRLAPDIINSKTEFKVFFGEWSLFYLQRIRSLTK